MFGSVLSVIKDHDEVIINLECPLTNSNGRIIKTGPNLKASPKIVESLKKAGISIAALANNHIMDFGKLGLSDTIDSLSSNGIAYLGAGENSIEANKPLILEDDDKSIAIVAYAEHEYSIAGADFPGQIR